MTRQHSAGLLVLHAHFYTFASTGECRIDIIITITVAVAVAVAAVATTTVAIACQRCTCRFCSLLCWHCILLGRFDNSFYLRRRCRTSLVCLSFTLPHSCLTPPTSPCHSTLGMWKSLSSILNGAAVFFLSNGGISATTTAFHKLTVCIRCPPASSPSPYSPSPSFCRLVLRQNWHQFQFDFIIFHLHFHSARAQIYNCIYVNFLNRWCA